MFISHIQEEHLIAKTLAQLLEFTFGDEIKSFLAEDIEVGKDWFVEIKESLNRADVVLAIFSPYSKDQPWVNIEVGFAIMSDNKHVVPLCCLGLQIEGLPKVYGRYNATDVYSEAGIRKLLDMIASKTRARRLTGNAGDTVRFWKQRLDEQIPASLESPRLPPGQQPIVWLIGSYGALEGDVRNKASQVSRVLCQEFLRQTFHLVMGSTAMLDRSMMELIEYDYEADSGKELRQDLSTFSATLNKQFASPCPVILLGSLRSSQGVRRIFYEAIGKVPELGVLIGGNPNGRSPDEVRRAKAGKIPLLSLQFTGGVAARTDSSFDDQFRSDIAAIHKLYNRMDELAPAVVDVITKQVELGRRHRDL